MARLLRADTVVTVDAERRVLVPGHVRVSGDRITAVGAGPGVAHEDDEVVDLGGAIVLPGFVNAHHHLASTLLRGAEPEVAHGLGVMRPDERLRLALAQDRAATRAGALFGHLELLRSGVTTTADAAASWRGTDRVDGSLDAARAGGLRVVFSVAYTDRTELVPSSHHHTVDGAVRELTRLADEHTTDRVRVGPEALALPRASDELVLALRAASDAHLTMHLAYRRELDADVRADRGRSTIAHLDHLGVLDDRFLGAHPVVVDDEEVALLADRGASVAYCAASNMRIGSPHLDLPRLRAAGVRVGLGLDHPNHAHDFPACMRATLVAQNQRAGDGTATTPEEVLWLGTRGGAEALGMGDEVGALEPGRRADLVVLDADHGSLWPPAGLVRLLVDAGSPAAVRHVMVDGTWLLWNRTATHLDEAAIHAEVAAQQARVLGAAGRQAPTTSWPVVRPTRDGRSHETRQVGDDGTGTGPRTRR